ncbi:MAG: TVP38/TMEM64 family protein [Robiginitomaculum sp.]|nr:MAG: TVP38/TMEM64 family protein [Robiginitomaculum sp.]
MKKIVQILRKRSVFFWIGALLLIGLVVLSQTLNFDPKSIGVWVETISSWPLAIPVMFLLYTLLAFVSAPQWMLHGASVLAFGPLQGALIAWGATMVSASFDFWLGRRMGAERVGKLTGGVVTKLIDIVEKHGFWTSLIVRIVPTGPFVVVNMAAGVTRMKFWAFFVGTAIGVIPKIVTISFFGEGLQGAVTGRGGLYIAIVVVIACIWAVGMYYASMKLKAKSDHKKSDLGLEVDETR